MFKALPREGTAIAPVQSCACTAYIQRSTVFISSNRMASVMAASSACGVAGSRISAYQQQARGPSTVARCPHHAPALFSSPSSRQLAVVTRDSRSESSFVTGFVLGGVVFGALGFLFAPQISKALLGDDQRLKLPRFLEDEASKDPEATKQELIEKIAALNASIDKVAAELEKNDKVEIAA